jgi:long-chain acyl-CoA synthetase
VVGGQVSFSATQETLPRVLRQARPTTFGGVPRIWEKILDQLTAHHVGSGEDALRLVGLDEVTWAGTSGAPMSPDIVARLRDFGLPVSDMWGLSEATGLTTVARSDRPATVGQALPGTEVALAPDGELLVSGAHVATGYLQPDDSITPIVDSEEWLATGDLGSIDADGYVRITGRKKEILVTSGGKNISPVAVESLLTRSPMVAQAMAYGNDRPYLVALLTVAIDYAVGWLRKEHGLGTATLTSAEVAGHPAVLAEVAREVERANAQLARAEQIKRWTLLAEPWTTADGALTPTMKLRRPIIQQRHHDALDSLYRADSDPAGTGPRNELA